MTSPGGTEVGRVSIRVLPDTSQFAEEMKAKLKKALKGFEIKIPVTLDTSAMKAEMEKVKAEAKKAPKVPLKVEVDGDGVVRETRRVRLLAQKVTGAIRLVVTVNIPASIAAIMPQLRVIGKFVQGYKISIPMEVVGISKWLAILATLSGVLLAIPHLIGAIGGAVSVAGGALALLPALAAAASVGIAALAVGLKGFFTALKDSGDPVAFAAALEKLTPNARAAAETLATFKEPLAEIRKSVQERLFQGMAGQFEKMKKLLPPLKTGLTGVAGGIQGMTSSWIDMATSQKSVKDTSFILENVRKMFTSMRPALADFGAAFKNIAVVGSTFLPALGRSVTNIAAKFRAWTGDARETGKMQAWIQNAIDKIKQFFRIISDVVVAFQNVFDALRGGQGFLDILEKGSQALRDLSETSETKAALQSLAAVMRAVIAAATELFGQVFKSVGKILKDLQPFLVTFAETFGTVFAAAIRVVTPLLQNMAKWLSNNRSVMVPLAIALVALITTFKLLATVANGIIGVSNAIKTMGAAAKIIDKMSTKVWTWAADMIGAATASTRAWITAKAQLLWAWAEIAATAVRDAAKAAGAWIAESAKAAATATKAWIQMAAKAIATWVRMAAVAVANAIRITAVWIAQNAVMLAKTAVQMGAMLIAWIATWVGMAAAAVANAIIIAAAWLVALGPIALIVIAIVALAALIIFNWDKITSFLNTVWDACWKFVSDRITEAVNFIKAGVDGLKGILRGIGDIVGDVVDFFKAIGRGIKDAWNATIDWIKGIPGWIMDALGNLNDLLLNAGKKIIDGFLNGLKKAFEAVKKFVSGIGNWIADHKGPLSYDKKLLVPAGQAIMAGLHQGLVAGFAPVASLVKGIGSALQANLGASSISQGIVDDLTKGQPAAMAAVARLTDAMSASASAEWSAQLTAEDVQPLEDRILTALATGLSIELDGQKVTKSVNKNNTLNRRRG